MQSFALAIQLRFSRFPPGTAVERSFSAMVGVRVKFRQCLTAEQLRDLMSASNQQ